MMTIFGEWILITDWQLDQMVPDSEYRAVIFKRRSNMVESIEAAFSGVVQVGRVEKIGHGLCMIQKNVNGLWINQPERGSVRS